MMINMYPVTMGTNREIMGISQGFMGMCPQSVAISQQRRASSALHSGPLGAELKIEPSDFPPRFTHSHLGVSETGAGRLLKI